MPCYKNACNAPPMPGSDQWGFVAKTCCAAHWTELKSDLAGGVDVADSYLGDYARIKILMDEQETAKRALAQLAGQLGDLATRLDEGANERYRPKNRQPAYVRLSMALAKYEQYCWFPPSHEIFIGFVPPVSFNAYIAKGIMPKDPGAGVNHGDFTHRLHWHVISRVITQGFSVPKAGGWNHTPLELYTSLGQGQALVANMWFKLLDDNGSPSFTSPDKFHKHVREGDYGVLAANVARRFVKRQAEVNLQIDPAVLAEKQKDYNYVPDPRFPAPAVISPTALYKLQASDRAGQAYATRKTVNHPKIGALPVVRTSVAEDPLTLSGRIALSKAKLNKTAEGDAAVYSLAYSKALGMVSKSSRVLPRFPAAPVVAHNPN